MNNNRKNVGGKQCEEYYVNNDYPVDVKSKVHPYLRADDANSQVPNPPVNGGLYCGPQSDAPWMPKSVPPTTAFFMQNLVRNADPAPPPGAAEQYPGDNRLGNNYTPMPGVNWYNSAYDRNRGPFNIKVIDDKWNTEVGGSANNMVKANDIQNNDLASNSFDLTKY
tara:strand:+ start:1344 stop:1841 length:498 start_codon:yes stop_codon:yes gene_type:complete